MKAPTIGRHSLLNMQIKYRAATSMSLYLLATASLGRNRLLLYNITPNSMLAYKKKSNYNFVDSYNIKLIS